jgi:hypothetical protein
MRQWRCGANAISRRLEIVLVEFVLIGALARLHTVTITLAIAAIVDCGIDRHATARGRRNATHTSGLALLIDQAIIKMITIVILDITRTFSALI